MSRERRHLWSSRPGRWLIASSIADITLFSTLAMRGILMVPLAPGIVAGAFAAAVALAFLLDAIKIALFRRLAIA